MKLKPIYYQVDNNDFENNNDFKSALKAWQHQFKIVLLLILSLFFILAIGAGWGISHCDNHPIKKQPVKIHKKR